jgi:uncharacterized membrane protein
MAVLRTGAHRHLMLLLMPVTLAVAIAALGSAVGMPELPEPLAVLDRRLPGIFRLHMLASALALILLPWIILLRSRPRMHRALGRLGAVLLLVGAAASLPAAIQSEAVPLARFGFLAQGLLCLALLAAAIRAIRVGNTSLHARLMLQMSATIFGAVLLRVMMALATRTGLPFDAAYGAVAWLSWLLPFAIVSAWPRFRRSRRPSEGHTSTARASAAPMATVTA